MRIRPQIIIKIDMFGSRIRLFGRNLWQTFQTSANKNKITLTQRLALITASLFLIPQYIHLATSQQQPQPEQTPQKVPELQDQIINYIKQYDDAKHLNLQGQTLIWYECSGVQVIDDEVIGLLKKFVEEKGDSISCRYKIIIDTTPRSKEISQTNYYKKPVELVILKPENIKPINLSRYLSYSGTPDLKYKSLFQRLINQVNQLTQLNISSIRQFTESVGDRSSQSYIIMNAPKNVAQYRKAKKQFNAFLEQKQVFSVHANKLIVTDQFSMRYLGLPQYAPEGNNVYVLVPDSDNVVKQGKEVLINGLKYHIFDPSKVKDSVVFMPYLEKSSPESFTLRITADLNQNISEQLSRIYEALRKSEQYPRLAQIPKLLAFGSGVDKNKPIEISLQKNNFDQIVNVYSPDCRYSDKQKKQLIYSGNKWNYEDSEISAESLQSWIGNVLGHKIEPSFDSERKQISKIKRYNSTRITGEQYFSTLNKNKNKPKVVFHYSEHCFSCSKFKHIYEEIAGEKQQQYDFYRIDNDFNRNPHLINFNSTPVFAIYRGDKYFLFKNTIFTKALFQDFLNITHNIKLIDQNTIDKAVQDRQQNSINLKEFL